MSTIKNTFIDNDTKLDFFQILDNNDFDLSKYDIWYDSLCDVVEKGIEIELYYWYIILDIFNDYYDKDYWLVDIFNMETFLNQIPYFFKNNNYYYKFTDILNEDKNVILTYDIKPSYIVNCIVNKAKINLFTAYTILNIINDYYQTLYKIEDVFNIEMIIDYKNDDNEDEITVAVEQGEAITFIQPEITIYDYSIWANEYFKNN